MKGKFFWRFFSLLWYSTEIQHGICKLGDCRGSLGHAAYPSCASSETDAHISEDSVVQFVICGRSELFCPFVFGNFYECVFLCRFFSI